MRPTIKNVSVRSPAGPLREDAVVIPVFAGARALPREALPRDRAAAVAATLLYKGGFAARRGECRVASVVRGKRLLHVVLVGLGKPAAANAEDIADAAGSAATALIQAGAESAAVLLDPVLAAPLPGPDVAHAFLKGMLLSGYAFAVGKRSKARLPRLTIVTAQPARDFAVAIRRARLVSGLIVTVRDWVNTPANAMTPGLFADEGRALCAQYGVSCRVWGRREIEKAAMGGVLGVAEGSREEPRFMVMHYNMDKPRLPLVCLVGKGVTFDSGGISIKPWEKMNEMKSDMAGGAATVAAICGCASLELPVRVVAMVPCVENMPGGGAFRPGDVLTLCSGKTVEVYTTDAEGRLILADAVAYARAHYKPDVIVDIATLTGGAVIALGTRVAPIMGNDNARVDEVRKAGDAAGEPVWPLPLDERFFDMVRGEIADYKNYTGRQASPITGGALVGVFAESTPWVHIDIAGSSWCDGGGASYQSRGATGFGVDLLVRFLEIAAGR
ncbi:MAG: leucyl aminopeptidase [Candidatus Krumholzibacteria bacterium]|nr:leucyl aminopeptidase [Candidatus Krumholzibacteria bacterium]MDH4337068.1 leucyl aminopeptidase [Candidatus Krumholzibacteria bacterium]MDH5268605.1 leucyl aminopeptidase [Candidatus Krumholzibacteria bacterium]MDH5626959.1 leucyl aminopeptidase [Candidatus Krumholzibacteria bacterium]